MTTTIAPVPAERFHEFHHAFNGEGDGIWDICADCGGRCELHKIGTLMPGEKDYIAAELGLPLAEFEAKYLDRLATPRGTVDVLKLMFGCPFLDSCFHCTLADRKVKPVLCEIYPVVFATAEIAGADGRSELAVEFAVDEIDCPLMHEHYRWAGRTIVNPRWRQRRDYFEQVGIPRLRQVAAPAEFYWIVAQYDDENFDYRALQRLRKVPVDRYDTFTLAELNSCRIGHDL